MIITERFFNANTTWNGWTKMLLGLLLGCFGGLLRLVLFLGKDSSAVNVG